MDMIDRDAMMAVGLHRCAIAQVLSLHDVWIDEPPADL